MIFGGAKIIIDRPRLEMVLRTASERWLSWPWRPWVTHKARWTTPAVLPDQCITLPDGTWVMGEKFYYSLCNETNRRNSDFLMGNQTHG